MTIAIGLFAGLGFIFIGTQFLTANMKQVAGPRFHRLVGRATGHPIKAMFAGIAAGAVIQSTNAVTFIVISLVSAGAATVRSAMPIVTWSYAGSTLRLLLASLNIGAVISTAIGLIGLAFLFGYDRDAKYRNLVAALMGLALLLFGVQMMVQASVPLRDSPSVQAVLAFANHFYLWGFIAGTALAAVIQGQTVSIIALALVDGGVLGLDQAFLIVVGANLGAGIMSIVQGSGLAGTARQLNLYQLILKLVGVGVMLPLLMIEHYAHVPLIEALVRGITGDAALQVTIVHWMFQIVSAVVASALNGPLFALVERLSPETAQEALGKPRYIQFNDAVEPLAAIGMVEQEQMRLLRRLPFFLSKVRSEKDDDLEGVEPQVVGASPKVLKQAGQELTATIDSFLKKRLQMPGDQEQLDELMRLWNANQILKTLNDSLAALAQGLSGLKAAPAAKGFAGALAESAHALTATVVTEAESVDADTLETLSTLTGDRSALMKKLREDLWTRAPDLSAADRQAVWSTANMFEHAVWQLNHYVGNLAR